MTLLRGRVSALLPHEKTYYILRYRKCKKLGKSLFKMHLTIDRTELMNSVLYIYSHCHLQKPTSRNPSQLNQLNLTTLDDRFVVINTKPMAEAQDDASQLKTWYHSHNHI